LIAVSETWLKPSINSVEVNLNGFTLYRNDRLNKVGGGVAVYVRDDLRATTLFASPSEYAAKPEFMILDISIPGAKTPSILYML